MTLATLESGLVNAEQVAAMPECSQCGDRWLPADNRRWRAYLDVDDEVAVFCSACGEREFGEPND